MEALKFRINKLWIGLAMGVIGPVFGFLFFYLFTSSHLPFIGFVKMLMNNSSTHSGVISLSLIFNLVFFFAGLKLDALRFSQGVIGATLLFAPLVIYFKYVA